MAKPAHPRIFVSYARKDGAKLALRLQHDLTAAAFDVWLDTARIHAGDTWTLDIEEAIDRSQVVLALLTPGSYTSEICRAEQLRSLRHGKCVIPLLAVPGTDIPLHLEPKHYLDFTHDGSYAAAFRSLLADIDALNGAVLPPRYRTTPAHYISVPPTVANYIDRPEAVRALRDTLFAADGHRAIALTALEGMGGIGKTVLAQALFKDEVVRDAFPDGLVWITVGREPTHDLDARLRQIASALGAAADETVTPETLYRTTIADKAALIVMDDIWSKADLDPFLAESPRSRFLFTTRDSAIARFTGAREHRVDLLDGPQARELLALWAGALAPAADDILRECGGLPLALSTVGALLRHATPSGPIPSTSCATPISPPLKTSFRQDRRVSSAPSTSASKLSGLSFSSATASWPSCWRTCRPRCRSSRPSGIATKPKPAASPGAWRTGRSPSATARAPSACTTCNWITCVRATRTGRRSH